LWKVELGHGLENHSEFNEAPKILLAKPVLTYPQFIAEVKASDGNKNEMIDRVVARRVVLNLKPYGDGNFYINRQHEIGFTCTQADPKFLGGTISGMVVRFDDGDVGDVGDGPSIFVLDNCTRR
jgi:hypothetical protein